MSARIAIVYYSMYGHVKTLATELASGIKTSGAEATFFKVPETLPPTLLEALKAPPRDDWPGADVTADDLTKFDGILFGMPTRFGMAPSQMKALLDGTGGLWMKGALTQKTGGVFFSTGTLGGGQETTGLTFLTQLTHHGMIYVPLGYTSPKLTDMSEIHGGSPYGPGTLAGGDGQRAVSELEKEIARDYGKRFGEITNALVKGRQ